MNKENVCTQFGKYTIWIKERQYILVYTTDHQSALKENEILSSVEYG